MSKIQSKKSQYLRHHQRDTEILCAVLAEFLTINTFVDSLILAVQCDTEPNPFSSASFLCIFGATFGVSKALFAAHSFQRAASNLDSQITVLKRS